MQAMMPGVDNNFTAGTNLPSFAQIFWKLLSWFFALTSPKADTPAHELISNGRYQ
jgi:hypothetical protein